MNYSSIPKAGRLIVTAAVLFVGGMSWGAEFWLRTGVVTNTMPDGRQVVMWGFASDSADGAGDGTIMVPGPKLSANANESLTIHVQNTLPEPVSVVIPGQYSYQVLDPVFHSGGAYDGRVRSLTHEAAPAGGKATYVWSSVQPGTFLYHSASHMAVQVQMGLYGELEVVAPGPQVYAGIPFNTSVTLLFSEVDPEVHDAVATGSFGAGPSFRAEDFTNAAVFIAQITGSADPVAQFVAAGLSSNLTADSAILASDMNAIVGGSSIYDPALFPDSILSLDALEMLIFAPEINQPVTGISYNGYMVRLNRLLLQDGLSNAGIAIPAVKMMTSTIRSYAQYFMIDGQSYTNGQPPIAAGAAGSTILLRMLNAGTDAHEPVLVNAGDLQLVGEDGQRYPYPRMSSVVWLPALKTTDALWTPPSAGSYAVYDRRLGLVNGMQSPGGMLTYLNVGASGVAATAPAILVPPADKIAFVGQSVTFSVTASHVGTLLYRWRLNGADISNATASTYTIPFVSGGHLGSYTVVVWDGTLSTTSTPVRLTVVTQPTPVTVVDGGTATFSVTDLGPAAVTYQWQNNAVDIAGATNATYSFTANYSTDNLHNFRVVVNGPGGPATSSSALLTVTPIAPLIGTQPSNVTVPDFTVATFTVGATGSGLTYQWQRRNPPTLTYTSIAGATSASYAFTVSYAADNGAIFRVIVSRSGASPQTSSSATLTVTPVGPQILKQPVNTIANFGQPTNLTVVARASGNLSYQWQKQSGASWNNVSNAGGISGATSSVLAFNGTATANAANAGTYRVIVTSTGAGAGSVTSSTATLSIVSSAPYIIQQPVSVVTNAGGDAVTFTVVAGGFPAPTYRWQRFNGASWANLNNGSGANALYSGVTTPTLTVASGSRATINVSYAGAYRVVIANSVGTLNSQVASLTVIQTFAGARIRTIPVAGGTSSQYPSLTASVPSFSGAEVKHVTVDLVLTHAEPFDVQALLTTPGSSPARKAEFMAGLGPYQQPFEQPAPGGVYTYPVSNVPLTFDDAAAAYAPTLYPLFSGTFQPTVRGGVTAFPSAPGLPYATNLETFVGYDQPTSGGWRLYVNDVAQDIPVPTGTPDGSIPSWSMTLTVGPSPILVSFVQVAAATPSSASSVPVAYPVAEAAGDLNVVIVGWHDTSALVQSVSDSAGNVYHHAVGPTSGTGVRQSIYYATNVVGGSTTVTVNFNSTATRPDVRILEYSGVTALDRTAGASGSSSTASSGSAATTAAHEIIVGGGTVTTSVSSAGSGFTSRIITPSPDGDIAEDRIVTSTGNYNATATVSGPTSQRRWVMQMATFK